MYKKTFLSFFCSCGTSAPLPIPSLWFFFPGNGVERQPLGRFTLGCTGNKIPKPSPLLFHIEMLINEDLFWIGVTSHKASQMSFHTTFRVVDRGKREDEEANAPSSSLAIEIPISLGPDFRDLTKPHANNRRMITSVIKGTAAGKIRWKRTIASSLMSPSFFPPSDKKRIIPPSFDSFSFLFLLK